MLSGHAKPGIAEKKTRCDEGKKKVEGVHNKTSHLAHQRPFDLRPVDYKLVFLLSWLVSLSSQDIRRRIR